MHKKNIILALVFNSIIIVSSIIGLVFEGAIPGKLWFFTVQSNIWILLICIVFVVFEIKLLCKQKVKIPNWLYLIKYMFTVAVTLTFIVYLTMLLPYALAKGMFYYVFSVNNLCLHLITPVIAILSLLLCDYRIKVKNRYLTYSLLMPALYFLFVLLMSVMPDTFIFNTDGLTMSKFPYFFLNYVDNGWFNFSTSLLSMGVFYWLVILTCFVLLIGLLYIYILNKKHKKYFCRNINNSQQTLTINTNNTNKAIPKQTSNRLITKKSSTIKKD